MDKIYAAIDLKSFYASVECVERGLDSLTTNLVVADKSRTEKTICLAVSPSLKKYGIPGRPRLFEVIQKVKRINKERQESAPGHKFIGQSFHSDKLSDPSVALAYITAPPRMSLYMKYSTQIYQIYLQYFAPEDIHVYSIDEVFIDLTGYLTNYQMGAKELISKVIQDVLKETGITATAGIGTNLYLAKIAMDIMAKHVPADEYGVRIAYLDEITYRKKLWEHQPITDFWRVGKGYAKKLAVYQIYTMGEVATDRYGRKIPKHAHGTINLDIPTSSLKEITTAVSSLYDRIIDKELLIRRLTLSATKVMPKEGQVYQQLDLFTDYEALKKEQEKERRLQKSILDIKKKYGKNAVLRGLGYEEGATTRTRNGQIGGHKA